MTAEVDANLAELLCRGQEGDGEAYRRFLDAIAPLLRAYVRRRQHEPQLAEELVQEILLGIHGARHTYQPGRPLGPWIFSIAHHKYVDHVRRRRRVSANEVSAPEELEAVADEPAAWSSLNHALAALPARQREAVELMKVEGLSVSEAARRMQMKEGALRVLAHRAYRALRKAIEGGAT